MGAGGPLLLSGSNLAYLCMASAFLTFPQGLLRFCIMVLLPSDPRGDHVCFLFSYSVGGGLFLVGRFVFFLVARLVSGAALCLYSIFASRCGAFAICVSILYFSDWCAGVSVR